MADTENSVINRLMRMYKEDPTLRLTAVEIARRFNDGNVRAGKSPNISSNYIADRQRELSKQGYVRLNSDLTYTWLGESGSVSVPSVFSSPSVSVTPAMNGDALWCTKWLAEIYRTTYEADSQEERDEGHRALRRVRGLMRQIRDWEV
jgi:hypothetical protein